MENCGTVVLGCTHFNYFKPSFRRVLGEGLHFADGNEGTVNQVLRVMPENVSEDESGVEYWFSGEEPDEEGYKKIEGCMKRLDEVFEIN